MLYPCSVPDFISEEALLGIKDTILSLKDRWLTLKGHPGYADDPSAQAFTLGHAAYVLKSPSNPLVKTIDNTILRDAFGELHDKTIHFLKKTLEIDDILPFNEFTLPGFHIFRGPSKSAFGDLYFHLDGSIFRFYPKSDDYIETTYSFSSLIYSDPKAHLEYECDNIVKSLEYKEGHLNIWNAFVPHKIGTCDIEENQYRITYQGHVFKHKGKNYMYF